MAAWFGGRNDVGGGAGGFASLGAGRLGGVACSDIRGHCVTRFGNGFDSCLGFRSEARGLRCCVRRIPALGRASSAASADAIPMPVARRSPQAPRARAWALSRRRRARSRSASSSSSSRRSDLDTRLACPRPLMVCVLAFAFGHGSIPSSNILSAHRAAGADVHPQSRIVAGVRADFLDHTALTGRSSSVDHWVAGCGHACPRRPARIAVRGHRRHRHHRGRPGRSRRCRSIRPTRRRIA